MGFFGRVNEISYFKAFSENYKLFQSQGLRPEQIVSRFITDSPQSGKKPLRGFTDESAEKFSSYFVGLEHEVARTTLCNMVIFGLKQKVDISDYNNETMHQFIDGAKGAADEA